MTFRRLPTPAIIPVVCLSSWLWACLDAAPAWADEVSARIVNGTLTSDYPTAGALLILSRIDGSVAALCSGTMIGCQSFLTAAHCVCPEDAVNAAACLREGVTNPSSLLVFLQHAGFFPVASVAVDPAYDIERGGDAAVLHLAEPVTGIAGTPLNRTAPVPPDTLATIVGFGRTGGSPNLNVDAGAKRWGLVTTAACSARVPNDAHVCWNFLGPNSNTCQGDSGGPLFVDAPGAQVIAGIHAGGTSETCLPRDMGFDTSVFSTQDWIGSQTGDDPPGVSCGGLPPIGAPATTITAAAGDLSAERPQGYLAVSVVASTARLRIALNGQIFSIVGPAEIRDDFDLYVARDHIPTTIDYDCSDARPGPFGWCELEAPEPGVWYALASRKRGSGSYQLTATTIVNDGCRGDCGGDGAVTVDDLLTGVDIALELAPLSECPQFAAPGKQAVTVDDILVAVNNALGGCPVGVADAVASP